MDERTQSGERTGALVESEGEGGTLELFLTIENAIEDRVRTYSRLMRMKHILKKSARAE